MLEIKTSDYDWMRNDYAHDIKVGGIKYPTLEHAYQAAKLKNSADKKRVALATVNDARVIGKSADIVDDWEYKREMVMENLVRQKFSDEILGERLAKTGSADIIMDSRDDYWGTGKIEDDCWSGENIFGEILEKIRSEKQFLLDIDPSDYDTEDEDEEDTTEGAPDLKTAILNNPDSDLASACQDMYAGVQAIMTLIDRRDFDPDFISSRAGIPRQVAVDAIEKVSVMQAAVTRLENLLSTPDNS